MSDVDITTVPVIEETTTKEEITKDDFSFFARFDIVFVRILHKFYGSVINPVDGNINCYNVQQLHQILNKEGLKITIEGLRKKLDFLVKIGFLEKVTTYPRVYIPLKDVEGIKRIQKKIEQLKRIFL